MKLTTLHSIDSDFGVPIIRTPGVKKALTTTNEQLRRLSQEKKPVMLYDYNKYIAQHYAFMMKVILAILKPKSFG